MSVTIELAKDVEAFVNEQVSAGVGATVSELVNDVLRAVREQQLKPFEFSPALEAWLLESADHPTTPLTEGEFKAIRDRVRGRNPLRRAMHGQRDLPQRLLEPP
jgi:Arc/MetJ-type ribon-helix-helix transcriptional regulator